MHGITVGLLLLTLAFTVLGQENYFLNVLNELNLLPNSHFNAAIGAKVTVSPSEAAFCEEGSHCLLPWWYTSTSVQTTATPQAGDIQCSGTTVTCDRRCTSAQYSTPTAQPILFDRVRCNEDGSSNLILAEEMTYPIAVKTADPCAPSLNFVNGFQRTAGFQFHIDLDIEVMREFNDTQLLLLEGKLLTAGSSVDPNFISDDETFIWMLEKSIDNSYYLIFYTISSKQFAPRQMFKSLEPYRAATSQLTLFMRHIHEAGGPTCFYVDGLKAACLYDPQMRSRSIEFISLNSPNNFNLNTVSGTIRDISLYEMGQPATVISESEIQELYNHNRTDNFNKEPVSCLCQSIEFPFMKRGDWKAFSDYPSSYSKYCYADQTDTSATSERYNSNQHGVADAFDGDTSTSWLTMTGATTISTTVSFPHNIKVKALAVSLSVLPESMHLYDSSKQYLASVQLGCDEGDNLCTTWSALTANIDHAQQSVPILKWSLVSAAVTNGLVLQLVGMQGSSTDVLLINDVSIVATCYCAGDVNCVADNTVEPIDASINHKCDCPQNVTGVNCDQCSPGLYTINPGGLVDHPNSCTDCQCSALGTCNMVNASLCLNAHLDSCNQQGLCLCRSGNSTHYDASNPKCSAELHALSPNYGPASGGTRLTLTGRYLAGFDRVELTDSKRNMTIMVAAAANSVMDKGQEEVILMTPQAKSDFKQFTVELAGLSSSPNFTFDYRPNPSIQDIQIRDISVKGGFHVTLEGDYLDSSSRPVMLTYLYCAKSGAMHDAIITECKGNRTALTCTTADLADSLDTMRCIVTKRLKRAVPMTVELDAENDYSGIYAQFGFQFDGFSEYRMRNDSEKLNIYDDPEIFNLTESEVAPLETTLSIKGKRLTWCCGMSDYQVRLGSEPCQILLLLTEEIICRLPESWKISGPEDERNVTVILGGRSSLLIGTITKLPTDGIWDDKKFVVTIAISCTLTFVLAMIVATVICCFYYSHKVPATTKKDVTDGEYRPTKASQLDTAKDKNEGVTVTENGYQLQPQHFIKESEPPEEEVHYVIATELSLDLDDLEECDREGQVYYVTQESTNGFNNLGYYEEEV